MLRNKFVALALSATMALSLVACSSSSQAQYPDDTVTMIVSYGAGGGSDLLARALASSIDLDGETMVVTNISGGSGTIGLMECFNADPDGYTMALALPESYAVQILNGSMQEDLFDKLTMVACPVFDVNTLSVGKDSPFNSFEEVIAYAKEHPGEVSIAGVGSGLHKITIIDIMQKAGIELKYIPYEDSNLSRAAVIGGQADILFCQASESKAYHDSGEMKVLAVASEERLDFMADVPTYTELGYDIVNGVHRGFAVTPDTPDEIVEYLEGKIYETYQSEEWRTNLEDTLGYNTEWFGHEEYTELSQALVEEYATLVEVADQY